MEAARKGIDVAPVPAWAQRFAAERDAIEFEGQTISNAEIRAIVNEALGRSMARMKGRLYDDLTVLDLADEVIDDEPGDVRAAVKDALDGLQIRLTG